MATSSYTIKSGDKFNVFTGQSINLPAGTIIYGDYGSKQYYGTGKETSAPTPTPTPTPTPQQPAPFDKYAFSQQMADMPAPSQNKSATWNISNWQMGGSGWTTQPTLTINGKQQKFDTPQQYMTAMSGLSGASKYTQQFQDAIPYWDSIIKKTTQQTQSAQTSTPITSVLLTPQQQSEYFATQGQSATPLSPTDWLKSKTNINKDAISTLPTTITAPDNVVAETPDLSGVDTRENVDFGNETFNISLQNQVNNLKAQIEDENTKRQAEDQTLIDRYTKEIDELNQLQADNLSDKGSAILETKQRALDALEEGSVIFRKAQQEKIELGNQLQNLLEQGQALIKQQQGVTGLSSIRTPRINKTISDVNAQAGIIQAAINAKQGDMNSAFGILEATATAVSLYGQNELNYFEGIDNFYKNQKGDAFTKLSLDKEQKEYLDFKINTLKDELAVVENNKETLQELFTDPDMATLFAKAGISMNTPQSEWGSKIAKYENTQEIADFKNDKLAEGYVYKPAGNGDTTFSVGGKNLSFNAPPEKVPGGDTPDDEITLPNTATTKLLGAGFTKDEISQIEESVNTYAIKATLFAIDDENQRRIVAEVYGAEDILDQVEEELSPEEEKIPWWTTWFGIGK